MFDIRLLKMIIVHTFDIRLLKMIIMDALRVFVDDCYNHLVHWCFACRELDLFWALHLCLKLLFLLDLSCL